VNKLQHLPDQERRQLLLAVLSMQKDGSFTLVRTHSRRLSIENKKKKSLMKVLLDFLVYLSHQNSIEIHLGQGFAYWMSVY